MLVARTKEEFEALVKVLRQHAERIEPWLLERESVSGWCRACNAVREFAVAPGQPANEWKSLAEGMVCSCGLNGRMRRILAVMDEWLRPTNPGRALVLERVTPLFPHLAQRVPGLMGAEYFDDTAPGESKNVRGLQVRCENMLSLSFAEGELDLLMHFDVLEHVPDWRVGLTECARVLADGGKLLFTCPFYDALERNIVRAELRDGEVHDLLPRAYHGNPASPDGRSLVFIHPSWDVFHYLAVAGFEDAGIVVAYDAAEGIVSNACPFPDGHVWPVALVATRRRDAGH